MPIVAITLLSTILMRTGDRPGMRRAWYHRACASRLGTNNAQQTYSFGDVWQGINDHLNKPHEL